MYDKVIQIITHIREKTGHDPDDVIAFYTRGGCYQFYRILLSYFPEAEAYYDQDHVITKIGERFFDITGEVSLGRYSPIKDEPRNMSFFEPTYTFKGD